MSKITLATVNKALAAEGFNCRLYKGEGYHYFGEGEAELWYEQSVMVPRLNDLALDQWIAEAKHKRAQQARRMGEAP